MAPRHEIHPAVEEMCILGIVYITVDMTPRHEIHLAVEGIWLETVTVDMTLKHEMHLAVEENVHFGDCIIAVDMKYTWQLKVRDCDC